MYFSGCLCCLIGLMIWLAGLKTQEGERSDGARWSDGSAQTRLEIVDESHVDDSWAVLAVAVSSRRIKGVPLRQYSKSQTTLVLKRASLLKQEVFTN